MVVSNLKDFTLIYSKILTGKLFLPVYIKNIETSIESPK